MVGTLQGQTFRAKVGKPLIEVYNTQTYGGDRQVWAITQDKRGVMYFGHNQGLIEYDGVSWRKIATPQGKRVRSLAVDPQGTVYVGSVDDFGYLKPDAQGFLQYQSLLPALPKNTHNFIDVWQISVVKDKVNFVTFPRVFSFKNKKLVNIYHAPNVNKFHLSYSIANTLYQPQRNKGVVTYAADSLALVQGMSNMGESRVFAMLPYSEHEILNAESSTAFWRYDTHTRQATRLRSELDKQWSKQAIYCGVKLPNGLFAFGSRVRGIIIINKQGKVVSVLDKTKGLPDNTVWSLHYQPQSQNLWAGTDQGFARIDVGSPLELFDASHGLEGSVDDVLRFNNDLYVTSSVGVFRLKGQRFQRVQNIQRQTWGLSAYQDPDTKKSQLLVGNNLGLYAIKDTIATKVLEETTIFRMHTDRTNPRRLYVCFVNGLGTITYQNQQWTTEIARFEGLSAPGRQILQDTQNRVWVTTRYKGVGLVEGKKVTMFDSTAGLPSGRVYMVSHQEHVYCLTQKGVYVFDNAARNFKKSSTLAQMLHNKGLSKLWLDSTRTYGIAGLLPHHAYVPYAKQTQHYQADTMVFKSIYDRVLDRVEVEPTGVSWLSSDEGFFRYDARAPFILQKKFATLIRKVQTDPDSLLYTGYGTSAPPKLPYSHNSLTFTYAALYFGFTPKNQYSYQLVGYDKQWSRWTTDTKKEYTNLDEGKYTFRVKSRNIYGLESYTTTYSFSIMPPWYRTWWAYISYVLLFLLVIAGSIRWYTANLQQQKTVLEKKVRRRTQEIFQQKEEILAQNEELRQQSEEIASQRDSIESARDALNTQNMHMKQSIKSAETIQAAILPLPEVLQESLRDHFVILRPRDIVSGDFYYLEQVENQTIVAAIDCTGHGVPGAFMSLIGYTLLNDIIHVQQKTQPDEILEALRVEIRFSLKQEKTGRHNGMDVAMVTLEPINDSQTKVTFAGARRPLWYAEHHQKEVKQLNGCKISIGFTYHNVRTIEPQTLVLDNGSMLYMGSDGFSDQNNKARHKFGTARLVALLSQICHLPLYRQKAELKKVLDEFMTDTEQRDDILLMGIKL
jgi:serine phosphatase RsbU (regulator of sigma subunit)